MVRAILGRLFRHSSRRELGPNTRLTAEEAAAVAAQASAAAGFPNTTGIAAPQRTEAGVVWDVCQVSIGGGWRVAVDDASARPGPVGRWGVR